MNIRRRKQHTAHVEAGSLSDILFFLMLFFLIVSTLASPTAIKLLLPKASTGQTIPKQLINIAIQEDFSIYIEKKPISFPSLAGELEQAKVQFENPTVVLRCDKRVPVEKLIEVLDVVNKAKIPLVIATDKKTE